jgi:capsular exopolysaccharide synthesis family protein
VVIVEPAQIPEKPLNQRIFFTILAGMVGFVTGVGTAFLLEHLNDTLETPGDIQKVLEINNLGTIGRLSKRDPELIVLAQPRSPVADAFRRLAANLRFSNLEKPIHTLLVTSPHPMEGKTTVVANLAVALAQAELTVIAIDADLRLPRLHQLFGLDQDHGMTSYLQTGDLNGNLHSTQVDRLRVLTSGEVPENPTESTNFLQMHKLFESLTKMGDFVIIDSPPILLTADARTLATTVDGVLLVLKAGSTHNQWAKEAIESLRQVNANLVGVVLNAVSDSKDGYYYYDRNYGKRKSKSKSTQK